MTTLAAALPSSALPISPIQSLHDPLASILQNEGQVLTAVFGLVAAVWLIYTGVIFYHWVRYGNRSMHTIPALLAHFAISIGLLLMAASGFAQ